VAAARGHDGVATRGKGHKLEYGGRAFTAFTYSTRRSGMLIGRSMWTQCFVCAWGVCARGIAVPPRSLQRVHAMWIALKPFSTSIECTSGTWWANDRCRPCLYAPFHVLLMDLLVTCLLSGSM
jgi:hypothetical protein